MLLEEQAVALEDRLLQSETILTKIIAEAQRVDPNTVVAADAPDNLLLHVWQADEILLRQKVAELENQLPTLLLDRVSDIEDECRRCMHKELRVAYNEGKADGLHEQWAASIISEVDITGLGTEIDSYIHRMIPVLSEKGSRLRADMLRSLRDALEASRTSWGTCFFPH